MPTKSLWVFLAASVLGVGTGPLLAGNGVPPQAVYDRALVEGAKLQSPHEVIDTQALRSLLSRFDQARREGDRSALRAVDRDLKKVVGAAVRSGRNGELLRANGFEKRAKSTTPPKRLVSEKGPNSNHRARPHLNLLAFQLRIFYGKVDPYSLDRKKSFIKALIDLE